MAVSISHCDRNRKTNIKTHKRKISRTNNDANISGQFLLDALWRETQQLIERSEQLVRQITHVCSRHVGEVIESSYFCPRRASECLSHCVSENSYEILPAYKHREHPRRANEDGEGCRSGLPPLEHRTSNVERGLRFTEEKLYLNSQYNSQSRKFPSSGLKGSGAGPPHTETSRRIYLSSKAPSRTYPSIRPFFKTVISAFLLIVSFLAGVTESCSSRSTPKPRPASATLRPNVTFPTYACPPAYAAWFCLNGATCFTVKIQDAILYNCECAEGYMGPRCEFKDLDGSYLPARDRVLLETASIAGGACIAIILVFVVLLAVYVFLHKDREKRRSLDDPYYDKKPLTCSIGSDFICTITPVHIVHSQQKKEPSHGTKQPDKEEKLVHPGGDLYLVKECDRVCVCTCEQRDGSGHVLCANHFQKFVVPSNVPKYVV